MTPLPFDKSGAQRFCGFGEMSTACAIVQLVVSVAHGNPANSVAGMRHPAEPLNTECKRSLGATKFGHRCTCIRFASRSPIVPSAEETLRTSSLKDSIFLIQQF